MRTCYRDNGDKSPPWKGKELAYQEPECDEERAWYKEISSWCLEGYHFSNKCIPYFIPLLPYVKAQTDTLRLFYFMRVYFKCVTECTCDVTESEKYLIIDYSSQLVSCSICPKDCPLRLPNFLDSLDKFSYSCVKMNNRQRV